MVQGDLKPPFPYDESRFWGKVSGSVHIVLFADAEMGEQSSWWMDVNLRWYVPSTIPTLYVIGIDKMLDKWDLKIIIWKNVWNIMEYVV